jgi:uncharacterized protein (DUF1778 family)
MTDQTRWVLSEQQWQEFMALLDRPAQDLPRLRALMLRPSPFNEQE